MLGAPSVPDGRALSSAVLEPVVEHASQQTRARLFEALSKVVSDSDVCINVLVRVEPTVSAVLSSFAQDLAARLLPQLQRSLYLEQHLKNPQDFPLPSQPQASSSSGAQQQPGSDNLDALSSIPQDGNLGTSPLESRFAFAFSPNPSGAPSAGNVPFGSLDGVAGASGRLDLGAGAANGALQQQLRMRSSSGLPQEGASAALGTFSPGAADKYYRTPMFAGAPGRAAGMPGKAAWPLQQQQQAAAMAAAAGLSSLAAQHAAAASLGPSTSAAFTSMPLDSAALSASLASFATSSGNPSDLASLSSQLGLQLQAVQRASGGMLGGNPGDVATSLMGGFHGYSDASAVVTAAPPVSLALALEALRLDAAAAAGQQQAQAQHDAATAALLRLGLGNAAAAVAQQQAAQQQQNAAAAAAAVAQLQQPGQGATGAPAGPDDHAAMTGNSSAAASDTAVPTHLGSHLGMSPLSVSPGTSPSSSVTSSSSLLHGAPKALSMAAKLQQQQQAAAAAGMLKPKAMGPPGAAGPAAAAAAAQAHAQQQQQQAAAQAAFRPPADMPPRFRILPPAVQGRIYTLTKDNHVVLLKDFDEKVVSKVCSLVDKFGVNECLYMLDRIDEVLKGKAGRLANGPGYLDVSVSTRLDELKQRAAGHITAPEDFARSTLHSRIYGELKSLVETHAFLRWEHFDQGIVNMLKKMPNNLALERLNELRYHSFKNVDNTKSCIVSILSTKPKYSVAVGGPAAGLAGY